MVAATEVPAAPILAVMAFGVVVAIAGHVVRARWLVATGLALVFAATAGMLISGYVAFHDDSAGDPRQERDIREPGF